MNDNVMPINPGVPTPAQTNAQVIEACKVLLQMAEAGEITCLMGAGLASNDKTFEYIAGDPKTGIELIGQLEVARGALVERMIQTRKMLLQLKD